MAYIEKGKITSIEGNTARVVPCNESGLVSAQVVIPWHMRGSAGNISKGTEVVYAVFDDQTGVLLMRADGNWGSTLPSLSVTGNVSAGSVSAGSAAVTGAASAGSVSAGSIATDGTVQAGSVSAGSATVSGSVQAGSVSAGGKDLASHTHPVSEGATETGAPN